MSSAAASAIHGRTAASQRRKEAAAALERVRYVDEMGPSTEWLWENVSAMNSALPYRADNLIRCVPKSRCSDVFYR